MENSSDRVLEELVDDDPENALRLIGSLIAGADTLSSKEDTLELFLRIAITDNVNIPRLIGDHPDVAREIFGDSLPVPSEDLIEKVDRLCDQ